MKLYTVLVILYFVKQDGIFKKHRILMTKTPCGLLSLIYGASDKGDYELNASFTFLKKLLRFG